MKNAKHIVRESVMRNMAGGIRRDIVRFAAMALLLAASAPVWAQSMGLSPAIINEKFKPGQPFSFMMSLSNSGSAPAIMRGLTMDFWYDQQTNEKTMQAPGTHPRSASNWVEFVPAEVTVPANSSAQVKVIVTPQKEVSGGYYSVLFFESRPALAQLGENQQPVYTKFRLGALLLIAAEGTEQYKVDISDFKITSPDATHKLVAEFTIDNQSNTHIFPRVQLTVLDEKKKIKGKADGDYIRFMPGQKNVFKVNYPGELAPGKYDALLTIVHEGGKVVTKDIPFTVVASKGD